MAKEQQKDSTKVAQLVAAALQSDDQLHELERTCSKQGVQIKELNETIDELRRELRKKEEQIDRGHNPGVLQKLITGTQTKDTTHVFVKGESFRILKRLSLRDAALEDYRKRLFDENQTVVVLDRLEV